MAARAPLLEDCTKVENAAAEQPQKHGFGSARVVCEKERQQKNP
jgi:hypothetical protein